MASRPMRKSKPRFSSRETAVPLEKQSPSYRVIIPRMKDLHVYERISDAVGWTPMVKLSRSVEGFAGEVFAKIEYLNPMGSIKDRIARFMIEQSMREGKLRPGDVIIENSSGNTAMGLAMRLFCLGLTF